MIAYVRGKLVSAALDQVIVDVGGLGYRIHTPASILGQLPEVGEEVLLHTHFNVREDAQQLYGFVKLLDLEAFQLLLGVSGIGPKVALAVLSVLNYGQLRQAVAQDNLSALTNISGVGKKTAQRLLLELKDKLAKSGTGEQPGLPGELSSDVSGLIQPTTAAGDAAEVLEALGYQRQQAKALIDKAVELLGCDAPVEELVRTALKALAKA